MASIQSQMIDFHKKIKLKRFEENEVLREKRDIILNLLKKRLKQNFGEKELELPEFRHFNQGSYEMGTGVKPLNSDFDIDVGICFKISKDDYPDPVEVKMWVFNALEDHTNKVQVRRPCVTVFYQQDEEPIYHVDLAIYSDSTENADGKAYLAKGKKNSSKENRVWVESDPQELSDLIKSKFEDSEDSKQFRRTIRYLKRWKDWKLSGDGNAAPTGIALTIAAYNWFRVSKEVVDSFANKVKYDDLAALGNLVEEMLNNFEDIYFDGESAYRLKVILPISPSCDLFEKMSNQQMSTFKEKLEDVLEAIREAQRLADPSTACEILQKHFGDDFKIPSKEDTAQKCSPAIITSSASA